ncbi:hypothetical protein PHMEG_00021627 [Phytophthora megakarya]|uniref:Uncharacterized protein n=1 Tax=Phytophthora megakarya TaxID=4795 RepID=A0A225VKS9_9STRA|nr:hypothetical protein PHMEG_00021627 [Phytophthora megakarya]
MNKTLEVVANVQPTNILTLLLVRLLRQHTEYKDGVRDADFGGTELGVVGRQTCLVDLLLERMYLKSHQHFISEQRQKVAAKTLAGFGKKRLSRKRAPYEHEDYVSDDNDYVSNQDDDFSPSGEDDGVDDETPKEPAICKKTVVKPKKAVERKDVSKSTVKSKKPRKLSASAHKEARAKMKNDQTSKMKLKTSTVTAPSLSKKQKNTRVLQTWLKKYYKGIFLGLVDVAIVNSYIVFK